MKVIFLTFLTTSILLNVSCNKKSSTISTNEIVDTTAAILKYQGNFQKGPYGTVNGSAEIYLSNGKWLLKLNSFTTTNGPDLKVYLSKEIQPLNFIKVADLKSTSGNQVYDFQGNPDFKQNKYVLIHCEQFNHLFGFAELMMP